MFPYFENSKCRVRSCVGIPKFFAQIPARFARRIPTWLDVILQTVQNHAGGNRLRQSSPLVFLSRPNTDVGFSAANRIRCTTRDNLPVAFYEKTDASIKEILRCWVVWEIDQTVPHLDQPFDLLRA